MLAITIDRSDKSKPNDYNLSERLEKIKKCFIDKDEILFDIKDDWINIYSVREKTYITKIMLQQPGE